MLCGLAAVCMFCSWGLTGCVHAQAAFISSYMHSVIIFAVIAALIFTVFAPSNRNAAELGSIHQVYQNLLVRAQVRQAFDPQRMCSAVRWDGDALLRGHLIVCMKC